jgi:hypothetical protein
MVALGQVVLAEFAEHVPQVALPKDGEVVQALGPDRSDEPLRVGVAVGALRFNSPRECVGLTDDDLQVEILSDQSRSGQVGTESCGRRGNAGSEEKG